MTESATIVGVVSGFSSDAAIPGGPTPLVYRPLGQSSPSQFQFIVKASSNAALSLAEFDEQIRIVATRVDRDVSISYVDTLEGIAETYFGLGLLTSSLLASAAIASLILALIGVYGSISRSVSVRRREIGIRRAVGSSDFSVTNIFLTKGLYHWLAAVFLGGGVAVLAVNAMAGAISSQTLFATLSLVFTLVAILFGLLIAFSSYAPVRKIIALEPGEAMHYE